MPAFDRILERLGFVRLARYGLVLTPEDRVMSLRPALPEDGWSGRIVGWRDGDLVAMATPVAIPQAPVAAPTPVAAAVADAAELDEDDWEWHIALARARAVAEEAEQQTRIAQARVRDTMPAVRAMPVIPLRPHRPVATLASVPRRAAAR